MRRKSNKNGQTAEAAFPRTTVLGALYPDRPWDKWKLEDREVREIAAFVHGLSKEHRKKLIWACNHHLHRAWGKMDTSQRIVLVKLLLGLLPESGVIIKNWILAAPILSPAEIHFTLFCHLDQIVTFPQGVGLAAEVPAILRQYLLSVKSTSGNAAWMAADLLGGHWRTSVAAPILLEVAENARHRAARSAAIHGASELLARLSPQKSGAVRLMLCRRAKRDRSADVRAAARVALLISDSGNVVRARTARSL